MVPAKWFLPDIVCSKRTGYHVCVYTGLRQDDYQKTHFGQDSNSAKVTDIVTEAHNSYMSPGMHT